MRLLVLHRGCGASGRSRPSKASVGVFGKAEDNAPYRDNADMVRMAIKKASP